MIDDLSDCTTQSSGVGGGGGGGGEKKGSFKKLWKVNEKFKNSCQATIPVTRGYRNIFTPEPSHHFYKMSFKTHFALVKICQDS